MSQWQKFVTQLTQATQEIVASIAQFLPRLMVMLLLVLVGWLIAYALKSILRSILHLARFDKLSEHAGASPVFRRSWSSRPRPRWRSSDKPHVRCS